MAKDGFAPEIKAAVGDSKLGRLNTSPSKPSPKSLMSKSPKQVNGGNSGAPQPLNTVQHATAPQAPTQGLGPDVPHIAAATSIAHAILARRGGM
jgi:hypothetical protein